MLIPWIIYSSPDHQLEDSFLRNSTVKELNNQFLIHTVKPVFSGHSKIDKTKILMTNGSLMQVKNIAECTKVSILQYFPPALSDNRSWKTIFGLLFEWQLKTGFIVCLIYIVGISSHIDDEYKWAGVEDPKIMVTTSRDPSSKLKQFAKV